METNGGGGSTSATAQVGQISRPARYSKAHRGHSFHCAALTIDAGTPEAWPPYSCTSSINVPNEPFGCTNATVVPLEPGRGSLSMGVAPAATIEARALAQSSTLYPTWCKPSPLRSRYLAIGESGRVAAVSWI